MRVVRLFVGDADIFETKMRERIQQVGPADPVAKLRASTAETCNTQAM